MGVWIETDESGWRARGYCVTPCVGVWIETCCLHTHGRFLSVTPCVGVWIETSLISRSITIFLVTPCVGVWIETEYSCSDAPYSMSHPAWVCGLKLGDTNYRNIGVGHTLRGCVD